jgi:hypothetical protein
MDLMKYLQEQLNQFNQSPGNSLGIDERLTIKTKRQSQNPKKPQGKKIIQYTKEGEFVREFISIAEANRHFNLSDKYMSKHLRGKTKSCVGFYFKFKTE